MSTPVDITRTLADTLSHTYRPTLRDGKGYVAFTDLETNGGSSQFAERITTRIVKAAENGGLNKVVRTIQRPIIRQVDGVDTLISHMQKKVEYTLPEEATTVEREAFRTDCGTLEGVPLLYEYETKLDWMI